MKDMMITGSIPTFNASGITIAIAAACELTSLDVRKAKIAYAQG